MSDSPQDKPPHPHGPFKRTGDQAQEWEKAIGQSLDAIPGTQFPVKRTILQRYRALRIEQPYVPIYNLAKTIAEEVEVIWDRARVPRIEHKSVIKHIVDVVNEWKKCHKPGELAAHCHSMDRLLDLKPKLKGKVTEEAQLDNLRKLMRQNCEMKRLKPGAERYDWEEDYNFYIDQYQVRILYF